MAQLQVAQVVFQGALRSEEGTKLKLASLQVQVGEAVHAVLAAKDDSPYALLMEAHCAKQFPELPHRACTALRRFVGDAPVLPHAHGDGGYYDIFLKMLEALESGISKVDEHMKSMACDLLYSALTQVFSNLCHHDDAFNLSHTMESVPAGIRSEERRVGKEC